MDYSRQQQLIDLKDFPRVHIVGCGGIGSWIAIFLALAGVSEIDLWDEDLVEASNLPRTPYKPKDIGKLKALALAEILWERRPGILCNYHGFWSPSLAILFQSDPPPIVVGAADGIEIRKALLDETRKLSGTYFDVGAESTGFNVSATPASWQIATTEPATGYYTPIFIAPVAMAAAATAWQILRNRKPSEFRFDEKKGFNP